MLYHKKYKIIGSIVTTVCSFLIALLVFNNVTVIATTATDEEEQEWISSYKEEQEKALKEQEEFKETTKENTTAEEITTKQEEITETTTKKLNEVKKETTATKKPAQTTNKETQNASNTPQDQFNSVLEDLPSDLKRCFKEQGWNIKMVSNPIHGSGTDLSIVYAETDIENKEIRVSAKCPVIRETVHHELGHFVDDATEYDSYYSDDGLHEVAFAERSNLPTPKGQKRSHCIGSKGEYFASSFALYLENPNELKRLCPNTYKLVNRSYSKLINGDF